MKEWFQSLNERERLMVLGGGMVVLILLLYAMIWRPVMQGVVNQRAELERANKLLVWMKKSISDVRAQEGPGRGGAPRPPGQSLLSLIDSTAKTSGFGAQVKRVKPDGENKVQIWIDDVSFDKVIAWLQGLQELYGIQITGTSIDRGNVDGQVNVNVQLEGG